jgi:hypothetical protein
MKPVARRALTSFLFFMLWAASSALAVSAATGMITQTETIEAPIGRSIGAGGALRVAVDPQMRISLVLYNKHPGESRVAVTGLKNNTPSAVPELENGPIVFNSPLDDKEIRLEDIPNPDALEIKVSKGAVYAVVEQSSPMGATEQTRAFFLKEPVESEFLTRPGLKVDLRLVGSSQDVSENRLKLTFFKDEYQNPVQAEEVSLPNGQSRQWEFDADQIGSGKVEVLRGAVQFVLHQAAESSKSKSAQAAPAASPTPSASGGKILHGEVPLMDGATVVKETVMGKSGRFDLEVPASPEEVVNFYRKVMTDKGWQTGMTVVQGPAAALQLKKGEGQIMIKAVGQGAKAKVNLAVVVP